ncbi:MAG TPA: ATP-binding cassette domain-containing protein [Gemmatimonadaceae bacterium]|nr:ATP-binding cassette domain-containing protein [Gemmatimonadaceae bacterium]
MPDAIRTAALRKVYPPPTPRRRWSRAPAAGAPAAPVNGDGGVVALQGLDLAVHDGEFFGLLGPNGAGKTTTIGILTTRVRPTSGSAVVAGADVVRDAVGVRRRIGVVPQRPNPDRSLDVRENLVFHAAYFGIPRAAATARATELLEQLGIGEKATAKVDQLSGGQQQRLMIARALIHDPRIIFLDEPTVGLDPQARLALWEILRALHAEGRTIVMTTHYMEEADRLCDRIAIVDHGQLLALDTPALLKRKAPGGTLIELTLDGDAALALDRVREVPGVLRAEGQGSTLRAYGERGGELIPLLIRAAEERGRVVHDIRLFPPSLETLFIAMTGRKLD